jgi:hypothetical protein
MKKQIILAACLLTFIGCAKAPPAAIPSPAFASLNSLETALSGTWHLQQQVIISPQGVTTYAGYDTNFYITFNYGVAPGIPSGTNAINSKYFTGTWMPNNALNPNLVNPTPTYGVHTIYNDSSGVYTPEIVGSYDSYWYSKDSLNYFTIGATLSSITVIGGVLTDSCINGAETIVSTLQH